MPRHGVSSRDIPRCDDGTLPLAMAGNSLACYGASREQVVKLQIVETPRPPPPATTSLLLTAVHPNSKGGNVLRQGGGFEGGSRQVRDANYSLGGVRNWAAAASNGNSMSSSFDSGVAPNRWGDSSDGYIFGGRTTRHSNRSGAANDVSSRDAAWSSGSRENYKERQE